MKLLKRQEKQLLRLLRYSDRYEIDLQFWPTQISVFIGKEDVELTSFGGKFDHAINKSLEYLNRINRKV